MAQVIIDHGVSRCFGTKLAPMFLAQILYRINSLWRNSLQGDAQRDDDNSCPECSEVGSQKISIVLPL
jgi:hypothetical protein